MISFRSKEPVIVQGITGKFGSFHTKLMMDYGTKIAAGVVPGKGGANVQGVPVFDTFREAIRATGSRISIVFVPAPRFLEATLEAIECDVALLVAITEHVPIRDCLKSLIAANGKGSQIVGPNTPGIIVPGLIKLGIMPASSFVPGPVAIFSRSGTLMYEVAYHLSRSNLGQSMAMGVGGDPVNCTTLTECLAWAKDDPETKVIVVVGEIGGDAEERLSEYVADTEYPKPIVGYIAGRHAPKEKKMGHAGAIIYGSYGTAESKIAAFTSVGIQVAKTPTEIPSLVRTALSKRAQS